MAAPLPLKEQIIAAGRMALRCHTHLALWRLTAGVEGRARHREVLADHWEHIRFLEHGQLFTAVIELHSLLDANPATINLPHLTDELEAEHGPQTLIRQAAITPDQLQELSVLAIAITNELREAIDLEAEAPTTLPAEFYERMLEQLAK